MCQMDTDSNYFSFSEDDIEKLIKPEMREEYQRNKINFLPSESKELHPTFQVDGIKFNYAQYDKRKPGLFKAECKKIKLYHYVVKCIVQVILQKKKLNIHVKEYNTKIIILHIENLRMCYYMKQKTQPLIKVLDTLMGP